jgi:predicted DNA-binding ribbon-helix-helix protein
MGGMKEVTRTQTGVRLESRLLKVLKALATELDLSLGDLIEGIVLHAFEGKAPFSARTLKKIRALRAVYGLDLTARDSHHLREAGTNGA